MLPDRKRAEIVRDIQSSFQQLERVVWKVQQVGWDDVDERRVADLRHSIERLTARVHREVIAASLTETQKERIREKRAVRPGRADDGRFLERG